MYSHNLRNVFNISKLFHYKNNLINKDVIFLNLVIKVQNKFSCLNCQYTKNALNKVLNLKNTTGTERKEMIDSHSQDKINELLQDPIMVKKKKIIELEWEQLLSSGVPAPSKLLPRHWFEILQLQSHNQRRKYFLYLFKCEQAQENEKQLKIEKNLQYEETKKSRDEEYNEEFKFATYGVNNNSFLRRITQSTMNKYYTWNSLRSVMFGNQIVIDCSFDKHMNVQELRSCARQIMAIYASNRQHNFPFNITMTNVDFSGLLLELIQRYIPNFLADDFPFTITSKSYLELFDRRNLIYLTADSRNILEKYNPDHVYIIGAHVDKGASLPVSLAKAKEYRLKSAQLPMDKYIQFGDGSGKNLPINHVCNILLDSQIHDWTTAFEHVPKRKLREYRTLALENKVKKDLLAHNIKIDDACYTNKEMISGAATSYRKKAC